MKSFFTIVIVLLFAFCSMASVRALQKTKSTELTGTPPPDSIDLFWSKTREKLAGISIDARAEPVAEALPYKKILYHRA